MINFMKLLRKISLLWNEPTLPFISSGWLRILRLFGSVFLKTWRISYSLSVDLRIRTWYLITCSINCYSAQVKLIPTLRRAIEGTTSRNEG